MSTVRRAALSVALLVPLVAAALPLVAEDGRGAAASPTPQPTAQPAPAEPIQREVPVMPTTVVHAGDGPRAAATPGPPADPRRAIPPQPPALAARSIPFASHGTIEVGPRAPRWHGAPISLSLRGAPLDEVLRSFAKLAGVSLVIQPGVHGTVTCELHDVPWDQALSVILKTQGLGAEIDGRVWLVEPY